MTAFESTSVGDLASAVASIQLARSNFELAQAKDIALRRSGTRGSEARKELLRAEAKVAEDDAQFVTSPPFRVASAEFISWFRFQRATKGEYPENVTQEASTLLLDVQSTLDAVRP